MRYLEKLFSLKGKLAVVTGGSRGLGRGMVEALLNAGAEVILVSADENRLQATTDEFAAAGLKTTAHRCDLSSAEDIGRLCDTIEGAHNRLDILVNAAGVTSDIDDVLQYPDEAWERTLKINLEAPFRLCRRLARLMMKDGGSIINITSWQPNAELPTIPPTAPPKVASSR